MVRALLNLTVNALKFTSKGHVTVRPNHCARRHQERTAAPQRRDRALAHARTSFVVSNPSSLPRESLLLAALPSSIILSGYPLPIL
eukprot:3227362-Pleurochrysis_carterae.AAC.1